MSEETEPYAEEPEPAVWASDANKEEFYRRQAKLKALREGTYKQPAPLTPQPEPEEG